MQSRILTVSEVSSVIKALIDEDGLLSNIAVCGELSNYKVYPSGHHYFTLKDAQSSLKCVMFKTYAQKLRYKPESGMKVTAKGSVSVYQRDGVYQLYCEALLPEGAGELQLAFEQLKKKLSSEGLFDREHKKPIPLFPSKIAVITSSAGAAVRDIIRVLGERWPLAKIIVLPVRVQGAEAPPEITSAIEYANRHSLADVIIVGRGGGSIEDLWAFNDELVARAIFSSKIPTISAVGHEPDFTIADFAADLRAATPSNAAELVSPDKADLMFKLKSSGKRLSSESLKLINMHRVRLTELKSRRILASPTGFVDEKRLELDSIRMGLYSGSVKYLAGLKQAYIEKAAMLEALSPLKVLGRGYSITLGSDNKAIKDSKEVKIGDSVRIKLNRGVLCCTVHYREEYDGKGN